MSSYSEKVRRRNREPDKEPDEPPDTPAVPPRPEPVESPKLEPERSHFCAGVLVQKVEGVWCVIGITDLRFPDDVKIPGGTNKHSLWEDKSQTLCRELGEELLIKATGFEQVHEPPPKPESNHTQYFFAVYEWEGKPRLGSFDDTDGVTLEVKRLPLDEFWRRCFVRHKLAFKKAIEWLAREKFRDEPDFAFQAGRAGIIN